MTASECPFCGGKSAAADTLNRAGGDPAGFRIICRGCGGATRWCSTEEEAWKAWNSRYAADYEVSEQADAILNGEKI
jgi:Lar family restriction alleviation protein